ncbi:MAG TPA: nicotinamide mononucleotide transporter, partial [Reyranellaceae bacterium]|nr:nicotinamide mononucleotide transporter [Reyranellaceae bacterium]
MLTLAGQQVSTLEIVAALTGLLSVWLARRMHIGTWPAGIVSVSCLAGVFFEAKLYADSVLQVAF